MSCVGTAPGKVPEHWGPGQAEVEKGPRKMTREMEVFILDRLQSIAGKALILPEIHKQRLQTGLGEADSKGMVFQFLQKPPGGLLRFPTAAR